MSNPVSKYFNNRAKKRKDRKLFMSQTTALSKAINNKDIKNVSLIFNEIKDSPRFTKEVFDGLLRAAIHSDNTAIFSTLMSAQSSPNYSLDEVSMVSPHLPVLRSREHVLSVAIGAGSKNIALALAENKNVSVNDPGYWEITTDGFDKKGGTYDLPLIIAEQKGMHEVVAVLAERTSKEYAAQARQARAEKAAQNCP